MGLDDAITTARRQAAARDDRERQQAERQQQERAEIRALLEESAQRLQPYGSERLVRVKRVPFFGQYRDEDGQSYRRVAATRCWLIQPSWWRKGGSDGPLMDSPVLLLADGTAGKYWLNPGMKPDRKEEYVSSFDPDPLDRNAFLDSGGEHFVHNLKQRMAKTVVRYERGEPF